MRLLFYADASRISNTQSSRRKLTFMKPIDQSTLLVSWEDLESTGTSSVFLRQMAPLIESKRPRKAGYSFLFGKYIFFGEGDGPHLGPSPGLSRIMTLVTPEKDHLEGKGSETIRALISVVPGETHFGRVLALLISNLHPHTYV